MSDKGDSIAVSPTGSYWIDLPNGVIEQEDGNVFSYWIQGEPECLQLSSYSRSSGDQIEASSRLRERLLREDVDETLSVQINVVGAETAAAYFEDSQGLGWIYVYVTWPDLTVFATLSGSPKLVRQQTHWQRQAIESIRRRLAGAS